MLTNSFCFNVNVDVEETFYFNYQHRLCQQLIERLFAFQTDKMCFFFFLFFMCLAIESVKKIVFNLIVKDTFEMDMNCFKFVNLIFMVLKNSYYFQII